MKRFGRLILILTILSAAAPAFADDTDITPPEGRAPVAVDETHPIFAADSHWVGTLLIAVGGLFLAAVIVGQVVKTEAPDIVPVAMSHEEDPAADRVVHAGDSGKIQ